MLHETDAHRVEEELTARRFTDFVGMGAKSEKLAGLSAIDRAVINPVTGNVIAFFEVKNRNVASTRYPTWKVDRAKVTAAQQLHAQTHRKVFFVVRFTDKIGLLDALTSPFRESSFTLNKPRDQWDINDAAAEYPMNAFKWMQ